MKGECRNLTIESLNIDALRTQKGINTIINHLHGRQIDISRIHETHNEITDTTIQNGYGIYLAESKI